LTPETQHPYRGDGQSAGQNHAPLAHDDQGQRVSTEYNPRTGVLLFWGVVGLVAMLGIGFLISFFLRSRDEAIAADQASVVADAKIAVDVVKVRPTPDTYPLTLPGETAGWYQSTIYARVDGYVGSWSADIGDRVKQGQVLAIIDTPDLDQQLNAARAKAAASEAEVNVVDSDVSISKITFERWENSPKGVVSEQEREEKKAAYNSAVAHLAEAKAQAQLDEADVARYAALETFKQVTAPYDGVITARHIDIGDLINAGSSANTSPLYSISQSNMIRVFVDVPQKAAAEMVVGLSAYATSNQFPDRVFQGKVTRSSMSLDPGTRTQRTEVDIPNGDPSLTPGMYVRVTFELKQRGEVEVPAAAILFRPGGLQVAVVNDDGKIDFRPVEVAQDDGDVVELARGVEAGQRIALNLSSAVASGEAVEPVESDSAYPAPTAIAGDGGHP
jgi:RND family efflux transporter MFP subunit